MLHRQRMRRTSFAFSCLEPRVPPRLLLEYLQLLRRRNLTYLMWISLCDIFVSLSYIAIMCVQVYADYFESWPLFVAWHNYLLYAFTISGITFCWSSFLLMAATIERYLQSTGNSK
ncbi:unnamed protein product, partial [Mesorhabditis spiculigera]